MTENLRAALQDPECGSLARQIIEEELRMPKTKLSDTERRRLTLAALSGVPTQKLADEYGVSRSHVYKLKEDAAKDAEAERKFWNEVWKLMAKEERGK